MTKRGFYNSILTLGSILVLGVGGFAQGKHGGGDKHGGDGEHGNGHGRGQEMRQERGNEDHGNHGNGNGWGRQKQDDGGQQRAYQMQVQRQQQQQWQQQRENERAARQQNEWAVRQQRENEHSARQQQEQYYRQQREQQRAYRQAPQQYYPQPQYREPEGRHDNGRHLGWYKNGKVDGANNNVYQPMYRDWRTENNYRGDDRRERRDNDRDRYVQRNSNTYYNYSDPVVNYLPVYQQQSYRPSGSARENIIRSLIGSFFGGGQQQGHYPAYQNYKPYQGGYQSYPVYSQYNGGYQQPYYQPASYSPSYGSYSPYYGSNGYGYDPYSYGYQQQPYYGSQMFGGGGLKSTLLNVGLSLLQGFLGNGYQQGMDQGEYVRDYYGQRNNNYYDPYAAPEPAYYSPLASSFADQRQILEEGYRLGYRDAMLQQDPYGNVIENNAPVDLVSQFLANTLVNRI